ncbi:PAS domain S-box-containing protein [Methanococcoides vulcani]|uniref:histidine kinase n=1 Tax=Methanococcoides vulcani TaxID=1353158 RepID=A0A1H9YBZ9_9EURY|nr:response regulator [Methanococcoides vulcani]SES66530.1 PAS domain S-box-containing protein [Methanococcoides vulcani]
MDDQVRKTDKDVSVISNGCHFCFVYKDTAQLADFLQDYVMSGLDGNELCVWMTPDAESATKAKDMLKERGIYIDPYLRTSQLEIIPIPELPGNDLKLLPSLLLDHWKLMQDQAILNGFDGLRFNVDLHDIEGSGLEYLTSYTDIVKDTVSELGMRSLCTISFDVFSRSEVIDLMHRNDNIIMNVDEKNLSLEKDTLVIKPETPVSHKPIRKDGELSSIYHSSPAIAFLWKTEKGFPVEFVSDNVSQFGYDAATLMSHEILYADIIHTDDVEGYYSDLLECLKENKRHFSKEYRILDRNGDVHWISEHSQLEIVEDGVSDRYHGIVLDITEKKSAENELKESEAKYRTLFDESSDAVYLQKPDGTFLEVNKVGLELLGYTHEEFLSLNSGSLLLPDRFEEFKAHIAEVLENGHSIFETLLLKKDGSSVPVEMNASLMEYKGKDAILIVSRDITERKNKEENVSVAKANAETGIIAKNEFLANVTHELRTPLNAIIGFSDVMLEESSEALNEKHVKYLQNISDSGKKLLGIINDILDISRVESGNMELHYEHFLVWESFDVVCSLLAPMAEKKNVDLHSELDPRGIVINADKQKFEQVLQNLVSNAIKFTQAGGSVDLSARFVESRLVVQVKDTGIGISEEDRQSLFKSFSQADGSHRRGYGGIGLGLAIVRHFVEMHGGNVWVKSKPGVGSTFFFDIPIAVTSPRAAKSIAPETVQEIAQDSSGHIDIDAIDELAEKVAPEIIVPDKCTDRDPLVLVVEDDERSRELLMLTFIDGGYRVVSAGNGVEAVALARKLRPFAITLDVMLPEMDGWEVLRHLKEDVSTREIPVVMISMMDQKETALERGAVDHLTKPFDREYLLKLMDRYKEKLERKNPKILLVDDEPYVVELLSSMLEPEGFSILRAYSGTDAIDICTEEQPDIVILDLMMPQVSGFDVISVLSSNPETWNIPIVACTARDITAKDRLFLDRKVNSIMQKGVFSKKDLLDTIHRLSSDVVSK